MALLEVPSRVKRETASAGVRLVASSHTHMTNLFDLTSETAVVIGGTGVLGGAIAEGLASAGARVAILGRNHERGLARVEAIRKTGGNAEFFAADALSRESLESARTAVNGALGAPSILVNTAGGND